MKESMLRGQQHPHSEDCVTALKLENARLRQEASQTDILIDTLSALVTADTPDISFRQLSQTLAQAFRFDVAAFFSGTSPALQTCLSATDPALIGRKWPCGTFLKRVLNGVAKASRGNRDLPEAKNAPDGLMTPGGSTLFLPLSLATQYGFLILGRAPGKISFGATDIALARKFAPLASHIMTSRMPELCTQSPQIRARAEERISRTQSRFIANMSHELRTPLNAIIGFSEFMAEEPLGPIGTEKYSEYIRDISASGHQLLAQVDNILFYSKIEAGQHLTDMQPQFLTHLTEKARRKLTLAAHKRHVPVFPAEIPDDLQVRTDARSLLQILLNLLDNAIKFSPTGAPVRICGERLGSNYRLKMIDHGIGMPESMRRSLGAPFLQSEDVLARRHHGTGLGLAISFELAASIDARISFTVTEGGGTTACLDLPLCLSRESGSDHGPEQRPEQRAEKQHRRNHQKERYRRQHNPDDA